MEILCYVTRYGKRRKIDKDKAFEMERWGNLVRVKVEPVGNAFVIDYEPRRA